MTSIKINKEITKIEIRKIFQIVGCLKEAQSFLNQF